MGHLISVFTTCEGCFSNASANIEPFFYNPKHFEVILLYFFYLLQLVCLYIILRVYLSNNSGIVSEIDLFFILLHPIYKESSIIIKRDKDEKNISTLKEEKKKQTRIPFTHVYSKRT